ncbi:MAG: hypothetical protein RIC14_01105 [Filomicrobium sp.]
MYIAERSSRRLVLADRHQGVGAGIIFSIAALWLFGVVPLSTIQNGILAGVIAAAGTALPLAWGLLILRRSRAVFDADRRTLQVHRALASRAKPWTIPFDEINELYLHRSSDEGGPPGFQPFVRTAGGDVQLSLAVFDRETADTALDAAASFLTGAGVTVARREKPKVWPGMKSRPRDP